MNDSDIQFSHAAQRALALTRTPSQADKLNLYALYKQATLGDNRAGKPGAFDMVGKAKWQAWLALAGTPQAVAKKRYIALVEQLDAPPQKNTQASERERGHASAQSTYKRAEVITSSDYATLVDCLHARARELHQEEVFAFLDDHGELAEQRNYADLHGRACAIAAAIQTYAQKGQRILLLFEPGLHFNDAFYGCLYAGTVAVPAYPPDPARLERTLPRLQTIVADSSPALVLTSATILSFAQQLPAVAPDLANLTWLAVEDILAQDDSGMHGHYSVSAEDIALIQYTSGSTSAPKGVVISHRNIMINAQMMQRTAKQDANRIILSWLPAYHDLGLMCNVVLPVAAGARSIVMSPLVFLKDPSLWLSSVHRYRATDTAAPNFALDLCVQKVDDRNRRDLDLHCLKVCLIGAEPLRYATIERFLHAYEPYGLSRECLMSGYGLAEAVVGVTCRSSDDLWQTAFVDTAALAQKRVVFVDQKHTNAQPLIACGKPMKAVSLSIVNPATCELCSEDEIGELWIRGPQVSPGYWRREEESTYAFKAHLAKSNDEDWLRTGDLGFIKDGYLYVTGRMKDVIIVRGRNYYPQDIEATVESSHPRLRQGAVIAFGVEQHDTECVVIVAEMDTRYLSGDQQETHDTVVSAIRNAVSATHGISLHDVVLLEVKTIDKTSSGKLARQVCKKRYLGKALDTALTQQYEDSLPVVATETRRSSRDASVATPPAADAIRGAASSQRRQLLIAYLEKEIAHITNTTPGRELTPDFKLDELGLDSLRAMELIGHVERNLGIKVSTSTFFTSPTLGVLVERLLELMDLNQAATDIAIEPTVPAGTPGAWPDRSPLASAGLTQAVVFRDIAIPRPVFFVGGLGGIVTYLADLVSAWGDTRPFVAFQAVGIDGAEPALGSVEEMARRYLGEIKAIQPHGPYVLMGHSFGGLVAYDMAQHLAENGEQVEHLFLIDTSTVENDVSDPAPDNAPSERSLAMYELGHTYSRVTGKSSQSGTRERYVSMSETDQHNWLSVTLGNEAGNAPSSVITHLMDVYTCGFAAMTQYRPRPYRGSVTLLRAEGGFPEESLHPSRKLRTHFGEPSLGWQRLCPALQVIPIPGDHFSIVLHPHAARLASAMKEQLKHPAQLGISLDHLIAGKPVKPFGRPITVSRNGIRFDPLHPMMLDDPYPILHQLRKHAPLYRDATLAWWVTRYDDVSAGLRDKRFSPDSRLAADAEHNSWELAHTATKRSLMSAWTRQMERPLISLLNEFMVLNDPPKHQKLRRFFSVAFEPSNLSRMKDGIDRRVDALVADLRLRRDPDIVRDFALKLPLGVVSELLGIPPQDTFILQAWGEQLVLSLDPTLSIFTAQHCDESAVDFMRYMHDHIDKRRQKPPQDDVLGILLEAHKTSSLSTDEFVANCIFLFIAAFETTASVISSGVLALLRHPDQWQLLREHPELAENAVDEFLRYEGSFRLIVRTALEDVDMRGARIQRGDSVFFVVSAANRDPEAFPDPDRLDVTRNAKHHVAFAHGIHYCVGASLAKMEIQSAISALVRQDFSLVPGGIAWRNSMTFRRLERLPIRFN
nr:acyl-CoA-binding protein [Luteibacter sp. Sphag1AF]